MNTQLIPVSGPSSFRLVSLIPQDKHPPPVRQALTDLADCLDELWQKTPPDVQDLLLRFFRSVGVPLAYPSLPFWAERAARHVFTIFYPTLRKEDWANPSFETIGKVTGHLLAIVRHSQSGTAFFNRLAPDTAAEARRFFGRIDRPLRVLISEALERDPTESGPFLKGLEHAFARTFDAVGLPRGWNTNSPVLLWICMAWRYIATKSPTLPSLHRELVKFFREQEQMVGSEDRVKKICSRLGLRFSGDRTSDRQGTTVILDVPTEPEPQRDK